jgi:hypothetical protein
VPKLFTVDIDLTLRRKFHRTTPNLRDGIVSETTGLYARHKKRVAARQIRAPTGLATPLRVV